MLKQETSQPFQVITDLLTEQDVDSIKLWGQVAMAAMALTGPGEGIIFSRVESGTQVIVRRSRNVKNTHQK